MEILTGEQMRQADRHAIDVLGVPSLLLMEAAGQGISAALRRDLPRLGEDGVLILCGKGNNGGDGLVVARHLARAGVRASVVLLARARDLKSDAAANHRAALANGVSIDEVPDERTWARRELALERFGVVVDAILGTGSAGGARGFFGTVITAVNERARRVVAVDIPSGMNADSTKVEGVVLRAHRTYTLCRPKLPLVLGETAELAGRWVVIPIGIPDAAVASVGATLDWLDSDAMRGILPPRAPADHKGTFGHLLVVAGSRGQSGAAVLAARGALRSGAGLVTLACPASAQAIVAPQQAEVMTAALPEPATGAVARRATAEIAGLLTERDALAIGPGLGTEKETRDCVLATMSKATVPVVVDAAGLDALVKADVRKLRGEKRAALVLTPHPGEAARLLDTNTAKVQADRLGAARKLAERLGAVVVLKGHRTLVASPDGRVSVNSTGNPCMATGGTGDVLAGMLGALLARRIPARDAARLAAYVHGDAGDRAAALRGGEGMTAGDLLEQVPRALAATRREVEARPW